MIDKMCLRDGCGRALHSKGLCQRHYLQQWKAGKYNKVRLPILCFVQGCTEMETRAGMCRPHYNLNRQRHYLATREDVRADRTRRVIQCQLDNPERAKSNITRVKRVS